MAQLARILVVDDDPDLLESARRQLSSRWKVETAPNGIEALARLGALMPDLVLADISMPGLNGYELCRQLRELAATRTLPVVLISGEPGEDCRVKAFEAGADDFLMKPYSTRELLARLTTHLDLARARAEAEAQRSRLEHLFMEAPALIAVLRGQHHVVELFNLPWQSILGGNRDLHGMPLREAVPALADHGLLAQIDQAFLLGQPAVLTELPLQLAWRDGSPQRERYFTVRCQPEKDIRGQVEGVTVFAFEVTEQVQARQRAEEALAARDDFLALASHELKTPISALQLQVQSLLRASAATPLDGRVTARLEASGRQVQRLTKLVNNLLDISRIAAKRFDLELEEVDLTSLVREVVARHREEAERSECALVAELPTAQVKGSFDRLRIDQVLTNLLNNAVKYGAGKPIQVKLEMTGGRARIFVRDHGIGISSEDRVRIFERFERAASARHYGGFGLGLWIVRQFVEAQGGTICVESEVGVHSTFIVELPLAQSSRAISSPASTSLSLNGTTRSL